MASAPILKGFTAQAVIWCVCESHEPIIVLYSPGSGLETMCKSCHRMYRGTTITYDESKGTVGAQVSWTEPSGIILPQQGLVVPES